MKNARRPRFGRWRILLVPLRGVLLLLGLCAMGIGMARFVDVQKEGRAYIDAPACTTSLRPGEDCLRAVSGRVTDMKEDKSGDSPVYTLAVARELASGDESYDVSEAFYGDVEVGTYVELKVWQGEVVEVDYRGHEAEVPHAAWLRQLGIALLIAAGANVAALAVSARRREDLWLALMMFVPYCFVGWIVGLILVGLHVSTAVAIAVGAAYWLALVLFAAVALREW
ncbi:hypothetical protein KV557_01925 [Kitasatospora aureofaciens]|uniref:hypothetical protein n=1 Tax=Kitasatospora aureofaciens TaxID=1894 RepID=UPI001C486A26|nr:hypothetical protein [Kitasatospora aureofaciens]MBV6695883.1 hypothetical protein [Kitasatospora aureofaciens]